MHIDFSYYRRYLQLFPHLFHSILWVIWKERNFILFSNPRVPTTLLSGPSCLPARSATHRARKRKRRNRFRLRLPKIGAEEGTRTPTEDPPLDPEPSASTNSATSAFMNFIIQNYFLRKLMSRFFWFYRCHRVEVSPGNAHLGLASKSLRRAKNLFGPCPFRYLK